MGKSLTNKQRTSAARYLFSMADEINLYGPSAHIASFERGAAHEDMGLVALAPIMRELSKAVKKNDKAIKAQLEKEGWGWNANMLDFVWIGDTYVYDGYEDPDEEY
jgi:hypothetical protein